MVKGYIMTRKEFIDNYADKSVKSGIYSAALWCYLYIGANIIVGISTNVTLALFINWTVTLGLVLGMHIGRSRVCTILLLVRGITGVVITFIFTGRLAGLVIILSAVCAIFQFNKADKQRRLMEIREQYPYL